MSDSQQPHGLQPTRLLHPWDVPGKSTGVGCHCLLQPKILEELKLIYDEKYHNYCLWNEVGVGIDQNNQERTFEGDGNNLYL